MTSIPIARPRRVAAVLGLLLAAGLAACADDKAKGPAAGAAHAPPVGVDTAKARELLAQGALVIDVREPAEFDAGHVAEARNIPVVTVGDNLAAIEQAAGGKDRPIVLYCGAGGRAGKAKQALEAAGFTQVVNGGGYRALAEAPVPAR